jgi:hypothetical protein
MVRNVSRIRAPKAKPGGRESILEKGLCNSEKEKHDEHDERDTGD